MRTKFRVTDAMRSSSVTEAALAYAKAGVAVLPIHRVRKGKCSCGADKCKSPGKHPIAEFAPKGHRSATRDPVLIRRMFKKYPNANVAIVADNGLVVADIDGVKGDDAIRALGIKSGAEVSTARGRHIYMLTDATSITPPKLDEVDWRFEGKGYVLAPPSRHPTGKKYEWGDRAELAKCPQFGSKRSLTVDFSTTSDQVTEGGRNNALLKHAGLFRRFGLDRNILDSTLQALNVGMCKPPLSRSEVSAIARSVCRYPKQIDEVFGDMSDVVAREVRFLFKPYVPRGVVTLVDGEPGCGKSNFTMALAAAVTRGSKIPWSSERPEGGVCIMSAEDDPARIQRPRLEANGADSDSIRYQKKHITLDARGLDIVRAELEANRVELLVIDPMVAYVPPEGEVNDTGDMMDFMSELTKIAEEFDIAILLVRHLRKSLEGSALARGQGSMTIAGRARSVLLLGRHPTEDGQRVVVHIKSNYACEGPAIVFELAERRGVPAVKWIGTDPDIRAEDLASSPRSRGRPSTELDEAVGFLAIYIRGEGRLWSEVVSAGEKRGHSAKTLQRAREKMGLTKRRESGQVLWALPALDGDAA